MIDSKEYTELKERLSKKELELVQVQDSINNLTIQVVDSQPAKRESITSKLRDALIERDIIKGEINILIDRCKIAYLKMFELALSQAETERFKIAEKTNELNTELNKILIDKRVQMNSKPVFGADAERQYIELESALAEKRAEAGIYRAKLDRARFAVQRCEMELIQAKETVSQW